MPASHHPAPTPYGLPPSALELDDGGAGWGEESAVFELPAPRPLPASAFDDTPARSVAPFGDDTPAWSAAPFDRLADNTLTDPAPADEVLADGAAPDGTSRLDVAPAPAFEDVGRLFNDYRGYVAKIGRRILGPSSEVDDLIQDVFLATVRDAHKIKDPARLGSWLGTVTTRMAKRRRFRSCHEPITSDDLDELVDVTQQGEPGPESTADLTGNIRKLLSLPDELRTPWLLKHVEGHTLEDVAKQCDCSMSTAARRIQSATSRLGRRR